MNPQQGTHCAQPLAGSGPGKHGLGTNVPLEPEDSRCPVGDLSSTFSWPPHALWVTFHFITSQYYKDMEAKVEV